MQPMSVDHDEDDQGGFPLLFSMSDRSDDIRIDQLLIENGALVDMQSNVCGVRFLIHISFQFF
jgi:hypothetical protein